MATFSADQSENTRYEDLIVFLYIHQGKWPYIKTKNYQ